MALEGGLDEKVRWFRDAVKGVRVAMLTTVSEDGTVHSRPLATRQLEAEGTLWFLLRSRGSQAFEVEKNPRVSLSYVGQGAYPFVSVAGNGEIVRDPPKVKELWSARYAEWAPEGESDIVLLRVGVESIEYWQSALDPVAKVVEFLCARPEAPHAAKSS